MDIVVIKFVAAFSIKNEKTREREGGEGGGKGGDGRKKEVKIMKEGYVISDTFFAAPSANAFQ